MAGRLITSTMAKQAVFIHGMWATPDVWRNWRTFFEARGWQTLAPALRHHDAWPQARQQPSAPPAAGPCPNRRPIAFLPDKPVVIGHSMGGLIR
jgi:pimeloyl-ACP methyl ester carboxylesterase